MKKVLALTLSLVVLASTFGVGVALSGDGSLADGVSYGDSSTAELNADASVLAQQGNGQGGSGAGGDGAGQGPGGPGAGTDAAGEGRGSGGGGSGGGGGGPPEESGPPDDHDDDDGEEEDALQPGPINTTGVIEQNGTYWLTEDVSGDGTLATAFEIKASDVTLDGNGFTVSDGTGEAIHVLGTGAPLENVTIRDMTITGWESGISAMNVKNSTFEDLVIESNNDAGLVLQASSETSGNDIRHVVVRENEKGVFLREKVEDTYIYGLTAEANHEVGLKVSGASYTHLEASTFVDHDGEKAIHITGISPHNTLLSNVVRDSAEGVEAAIQIGGESGDNYLWNNTVSGNQEVGISLGPPDNVLEENVVSGNGGAGVVVEGGGAEFSDNEISDNDIGVQLAGGATGATFDGDVVRSNEQWDVYAVEGVTGNAFDEVSLGATVVSIGESSVDFAVKGAADPGVTPPDDYQTIGKFVEAENTSADGLLDLRVHYEAPGDVDPSDQGDLIMGRLVGDAWEGVVGTNDVDAAEGYVYATITEFSVFAPMYGTTDITPPQVEAGEDRAVLVNTSVAFSAEASDDSGEAVDVVWDFGDGESEPGADVTHVFDSAGVFEVTATATDNASNEASDSLLVTVVGEDLEPPVVDAGEDRTVLNGTLVHFDATVSDDLGVASTEWDFGDGSIDVVEDPTHVFSDDGVYHVTLTVTDVGGNAVTDVVNVTVIDEDVTAPTAEAGDPIVTAIDLDTTFDASASTDDIGIVSYTWDFGDGSEPVTTSDPVVTHVYDEVYEDGITATLTVEDAAGHTDTDTVEVTVGEHLDEETLQPGPIDGFGVIETPGYYYLTTDLDGYGTVGTALEVKVGDVVIDGRGHSIVNGVNESIHILGTGSANSLENVTVRDLTVSDWETAVSAMNVKNSTFEELRLVENHDAGLVLASAGSGESTADNRIVDSRFEDNEKGVVIRNSVTRTTIDNSWFVENHEAGLKVEAASYTTVLDSNFVGQDGEKAIHVTGTSPNNWFEGNTVEDSVGGVENAIHIGGESGNNTLIDNVVRNNVEGGISIGAGDNTLKDNEIYGNGLTGVALEGDGNVLSGNEIYGNDVGLLLAGISASADLESNAIYSNAAWDVRAIEGASADAEDLDLGSDTVVSVALTDVALARGTDPGVAGYEGIGAFVEAENTSAVGELYLEVPYSGADVAGIDESALRMWRYDETGGWEIVGPVVWFDDGDGWYADADPAENGVNLDEGYVYATITEFSVFAPLVGDIDEPDADLAIVEAALASDDVTFGEPVTANGTIENNGTEAATVRLALTVDGEVVDSELVMVPAGGDATFEFAYAGFAAPGSYEVAVSGYDLGTVAVVDRTPPVPDAGGDRTVVVNQPVQFDASASTDDVGIVGYDWTLGENGTFLSAEQAFSHTFDEVGEYEVVLTAFDAAGNEASDAVTVTVEADTEPPTAVIVVSPTTGVAGEPMTFDASGSSDNAGIASYDWAFGDGAGISGQQAGHAYGSAGTYEVTLTVTDVNGNVDTASVTVTVESAPPVGDDDGDDGDAGTGDSGSSGAAPSSGGGSGASPSGTSGDDGSDVAAGAEVGTSVSTARNPNGSYNAMVRNANAGEPVRIQFGWDEPHPETGLQLRALTITANQGGDYQLQVRATNRLQAGVRAFDEERGRPLGYLEVQHSLQDRNVERAVFEFRVSDERLGQFDGDAEDVALYRYHDGEWDRIRTELTSRTQSAFEYRADSPGLSVFAVVLEAPDGGDAAGAEVTPDDAPGEDTGQPIGEPAGLSGIGLAVGVGLAVILVIALLASRARAGGR